MSESLLTDDSMLDDSVEQGFLTSNVGSGIGKTFFITFTFLGGSFFGASLKNFVTILFVRLDSGP